MISFDLDHDHVLIVYPVCYIEAEPPVDLSCWR
jgi:hypothetical protein